MRYRGATGFALALALIASTARTVAADTTPSDWFASWDGFDVCVGYTLTDDSPWVVERSASEPLYPDGATLRLSLLDLVSQPAIAKIKFSVIDDTIVLPDDWTKLPIDPPEPISGVDEWVIGFEATGVKPGTSSGGSITWGVSVNDGPVAAYQVDFNVSAVTCPPATPPATSTASERADDVVQPSLAAVALVLAGAVSACSWLSFSRRGRRR